MDKVWRQFLALVFIFMLSGVAFCESGKLAQPEAISVANVAAVDNPLYEEQCGSCHFAFQPGLLPSASWEALLDGLDDHFGENAELAPAEAEAIKDYLLANASERVATPLGGLISGSIPPMKTVLRITETPYFRAKHQLLESVLMDSLEQAIPHSNCTACHPGARAGDYKEDDTMIPGMADWKRWHLEFQ